MPRTPWKTLGLAAANVALAFACVPAGERLGFDPDALLLLPILLAGWHLGRAWGAAIGVTNGVIVLLMEWALLGAETARIATTGLFALPIIAAGGYAAGWAREVVATSERRAAELAREREASARLSRRYALLLHLRQAVFAASTTRGLFQEVCRVAVEQGGLRLAWVGEVDRSAQRVAPLAVAGADRGYVSSVGIDLTDPVRREGPTGLAARHGGIVTVRDVASDPRMAPWRASALERGFLSTAAVPIGVNGNTYVLSLYAGEPDFFEDDYAPLLTSFAEHVKLSLAKRTAEEARGEAERSLRESERRFQQIAESVQEIIFLADPFGDRVMYVNPAFYARTGYARGALGGLEGGGWSKILDAEDRPRFEALFDTVRDEGAPATLDFRWTHADGSRRWARARLFPVRTHDGTIFRVAGIVEDTTELHAQAEAAEKARAQEAEIQRLRAVAQAKAQFLNTAAHELSNPMTPIRFQIEMLERGFAGPLTPEQREAVETLQRNLDRVATLVRDLLDASRIETGKIVLKPAPLDLVDVLRHAVGSFQATAAHVGVTLALEAQGAALVLADRTRLDQLLSNLVDNAIKFTPTGGRVTLRLVVEGTHATVSVQDTGIGLTPEQRAKLFTPFGQVGEGSPHGRSGTGLGLYIAKGLVQQHGGDIGVESDGLRKGSTFWFRLPLLSPLGSPDRERAQGTSTGAAEVSA